MFVTMYDIEKEPSIPPNHYGALYMKCIVEMNRGPICDKLAVNEI